VVYPIASLKNPVGKRVQSRTLIGQLACLMNAIDLFNCLVKKPGGKKSAVGVDWQFDVD
jgi:hypothetical protein